jgi:hypothetical protein
MDINFGTPGSGGGGAWITVVGTLGGVAISALVALFLQRGQRRHDASEKAIDRSNALRKDACVKATETMTAAINALVNTGTGDMEEWNKARIAFLASLQQLRLVGSERTVVCASEVELGIATASTPITVAGQKLRDAMQAAKLSQSRMDATRAELASLIQAMQKSGTVTSAGDYVRALNFDQRIGLANATIEVINDELAEAKKNHEKAAKEFLRTVGRAIEPVQKVVVKLMHSIRMDLGHPELSLDTQLELARHQATMKNTFFDLVPKT